MAAAEEDGDADEGSVRANEHYQAGLAAVEAQNHEEALAHFNRAAFLVPDEPVLYVARAEVYVRLCDLKSAASNYRKALSLQPNPDPTYRNRLAAVLDSLGVLLFSQRRSDRALAFFDEALAHSQSNRVVLLHRSLALFVLGRHEQALADAVQCEGTELCSPWVYVAEGTMHLLRRNFAEAKSSIEKAMLVAADNPHVAALEKLFYAEFDHMKGQGVEAMEEERWPDAVAVLDQCILAFPHDPELYKMRSQCHTAMRKYTAAVQDLFESINKSGMANAEAASQLARTLVLIADELSAKNDFTHAVSYCDEALRWDHKMSAAYIRRADCHRQLGSHEKALADYRKVLEIDPEDPHGRFKLSLLHNEWGTILYNDGKFGLAEHEFTRAINYHSGAALFHFNRAKCLLMLQQPTAAIRELAACRDLNPDDPEMWKMINQFCPPGSDGTSAFAPSTVSAPRPPKTERAGSGGRRAAAAVASADKRDRREPKGLVLRPVRYTPPVLGSDGTSSGDPTPLPEKRDHRRVLGNDEMTRKLAPITGFEAYTNFKSGDSAEMYSLRKEKGILQDPYGVAAVRDVAQTALDPKKSHSARRYGRWDGAAARAKVVSTHTYDPAKARAAEALEQARAGKRKQQPQGSSPRSPPRAAHSLGRAPLPALAPTTAAAATA
eukprot:TRINITY_DN50102_c0_g1_i1.p1 TRINITY_DN50102_c0_g1~~TRINITY_DN50102_c0_g1_i1.p1  ORF type:complete len:691 (+),score=176.64 TRINITY_DN50102_c0_g1_i1:81-2075(+)